jgi:hypothetical protein
LVVFLIRTLGRRRRKGSRRLKSDFLSFLLPFSVLMKSKTTGV